jgi:Protein of unknown function (DUF4236)
MGWYLRKAFSFGPLRLNLSKSGLGYSFGVRGARIGVGPRGTYVHMGRGGIYYRKTLASPSSGQDATVEPAPVPPDICTESLKTIETADASSLHDSSAADLLSELQEKAAKPRYSIITAVSAVIVLTAAIMSGGSLILCTAFAIVCAVLHYQCQNLDIERKRVVLRYELDKDAGTDYASLLSVIAELSHSCGIWRLTGQDNCLEPKYHAGAGKLVDRKSMTVSLAGPAGVETNLAIWRFDFGQQVYYFLPDRLLLTQEGVFGGIEYRDLDVKDSTTRFIEEGGVPSDSQVVDWTWRYTNKGGGPDRRFANNSRIPVVQYGEIHLRSASGLHLVMQVSDPNKLERFATGLREYARHCHALDMAAPHTAPS